MTHTTTNEKAPGTCDSKGLRTDTTNDLNFLTGQREGKAESTLRARCALAGVTLHQIESDHGKTVFIVSRWNMTRELNDIESVSAWLEKVTGVSA